MILLLCAPAASHAQTAIGNPENWCRNGAFPEDGPDFRVARIAGAKGARVHFYGDDGDCPNGSEAKCRQKSYLIPGDEVIVTRRFGGWVCGWYQPRRGSETVGWLPSESLTIAAPDAAPPTGRWVGSWKFYEQTLDIKRDGATGFLSVEGQAFWRGLGDNVHVGEVHARAKPRGGELTLVEDECRVSLRLVGDYLVASDNSQCGGVNVRFNGVYRKRSQP